MDSRNKKYIYEKKLSCFVETIKCLTIIMKCFREFWFYPWRGPLVIDSDCVLCKDYTNFNLKPFIGTKITKSLCLKYLHSCSTNVNEGACIALVSQKGNKLLNYKIDHNEESLSQAITKLSVCPECDNLNSINLVGYS